MKVIVGYIPFLFSLCFHEYAHGWMARRKGDNTALMMGRLTMNPIAHIDIMGTVVMPIMMIVFPGLPLFGWAKPVPVNERNLRDPRNDMFWVALAGPAANILLYICGLAFAVFLTKQTFFAPSPLLYEMLQIFLVLNLVLAIFNLLPLHPLDGGKIVGRFLPRQWNYWLESKQQYGFMIIMLLVIFGGTVIIGLPVRWIYEHSMSLLDKI